MILRKIYKELLEIRKELLLIGREKERRSITFRAPYSNQLITVDEKKLRDIARRLPQEFFE